MATFFNYLTSKPGVIRRTGSQVKLDKDTETKLKTSTKVEVFFLGFSPKFPSEAVNGGNVLPDAADYYALRNLHEHIAEARKMGLELSYTIVYEGSLYPFLGPYSEKEVQETFQILNEMNETIGKELKTEGSVRIIDVVPMLDQLIPDLKSRFYKAYRQVPSEAVESWVKFYKRIARPGISENRMRVLGRAYLAFNAIKYSGGEHGLGLRNLCPDAVPATVSAKKYKLTVQLLPYSDHFPHHGVALRRISKNRYKWSVVWYSELSSKFVVPHYKADQSTPWYWEEIRITGTIKQGVYTGVLEDNTEVVVKEERTPDRAKQHMKGLLLYANDRYTVMYKGREATLSDITPEMVFDGVEPINNESVVDSNKEVNRLPSLKRGYAEQFVNLSGRSVSRFHGDLHVGNILFYKDQMFLIDWNPERASGSLEHEVSRYLLSYYREYILNGGSLRELRTQELSAFKYLRDKYGVNRLNIVQRIWLSIAGAPKSVQKAVNTNRLNEVCFTLECEIIHASLGLKNYRDKDVVKLLKNLADGEWSYIHSFGQFYLVTKKGIFDGIDFIPYKDFMSKWVKVNLDKYREPFYGYTDVAIELDSKWLSGVPVMVGGKNMIVTDFIGLGKESRVYLAETSDGEKVAIKLGLCSLREEYEYTQKLSEHTSVVVKPLHYDEEKNIIVMEMIEGQTADETRDVYAVLFAIKEILQLWLNHKIMVGQFNARNVIVMPDQRVRLIDVEPGVPEELYEIKQAQRIAGILLNKLGNKSVGDLPLRIKQSDAIVDLPDDVVLGKDWISQLARMVFVEKNSSLKEIYEYLFPTVGAVATDINGTIDDDKGNLTQDMIDTIKSLPVPVLLVTGKPLDTVKEYCSRWGIPETKFIISCRNGAVYYRDGMVIYQHRYSAADHIISKAEEMGLQVISHDDYCVALEEKAKNYFSGGMVHRGKYYMGHTDITKETAVSWFAKEINCSWDDIAKFGNEPDGNDQPLNKGKAVFMVNNSEETLAFLKLINYKANTPKVSIRLKGHKVVLEDFSSLSETELDYLKNCAKNEDSPFYPYEALSLRLRVDDPKKMDHKWAIYKDGLVCGIVFAYQRQTGIWNIGMYLTSDARGGGVGVDVMKTVMRYVEATSEFVNYDIRVAANNIASQKLLEKVGLTVKKTEKNTYRFPNGEVADTLYYYLPNPLNPERFGKEEAKLAEYSLKKLLQLASSKSSSKEVITGIKPQSSIESKLRRKNYTSIFRFTDLVRGAVLVQNPEQLHTAVDEICSRASVINKEYKNGNEYRGAYHLDVLLEGGIVAEVQVMTKTLWYYKKQAHKVYTIMRELNAAQDAAKIGRMVKDCRRIFNGAVYAESAKKGNKKILYNS